MTTVLFELADNNALREYIESNLFDPWRGTAFEGYRYMDNKQKGEFGERYVSVILESLGHSVEDPHSNTAGYDRIVNGIKTEIKFSLSQTDNKRQVLKEDMFMMNHVSECKDWERLIFLGVNGDPDKLRMGWITKEDFIACKQEFFNTQQGGKSGENDDYMCGSKKLIALLESKYMRSIFEW